MLTHQRLKTVLSYDETTGELTWKIKTSKKTVIGSKANSRTIYGYIRVRIDGTTYQGHRLAWFYAKGEMPSGQIDHINGVRTDNRISNLRDVSRCVNQQNQRDPQKGNKSGFLGVSWNRKDKKWWSRISVNGKFKYLGSFDSPESAHLAYVVAKREFHAGCTI